MSIAFCKTKKGFLEIVSLAATTTKVFNFEKRDKDNLKLFFQLDGVNKISQKSFSLSREKN